MAAAQDGDAGAYESLLLALLPVLRAFVRRRGIDATEGEDVVQEILILIHRARHTWLPERPFDPWMWAVARNATTDAMRRQGRDRARRDEMPEQHDERFLSNEAVDPVQLLSSRELEPRLTAALGTLPATQREAVELLYVEQLPVAEAAVRAGVTVAALKVRAHRGSRALRAVLDSEPES